MRESCRKKGRNARKTKDDIAAGKDNSWTGEVVEGVAEAAGGVLRDAKGWLGF